MSFFVKRENIAGEIGWTGPIRSERQANREADAWRCAGRDAEVLVSTPDVRRQVRDWERAKRNMR